MALPDSAKIVLGTPILLAASTYAPTGNNSLGSRTDDLDLTSVAAGAAEQSARFDFTANFDMEYVLGAAIEWATAPAAGETVDFYMGYSNSNDQVGWPAGLDGGTASTGYAGYSANLDDSLKQLVFLGSMVATVQASPNVQIDTNIATFTPRDRYGSLVVVNNSAADALHTDAVEMAVRLQPLTYQVQD